jgi:hypothetical protein
LAAGCEAFGDCVIATTILDRILHHAITLNIRRNSYEGPAQSRARQAGRAHYPPEERVRGVLTE